MVVRLPSPHFAIRVKHLIYKYPSGEAHGTGLTGGDLNSISPRIATEFRPNPIRLFILCPTYLVDLPDVLRVLKQPAVCKQSVKVTRLWHFA